MVIGAGRLGVRGLTVAMVLLGSSAAMAQDPCRVLNIPRFDAKPEADREWIGDRGHPTSRAGVAWFGRFDRNSAYAEVRASYDAEGLNLRIFVADLHVWWVLTDGAQFGGELVSSVEGFDAIEIGIDPADLLGTAASGAPSPAALRVVVGNYPYPDPVGAPETAEPHLATVTYAGTGEGWAPLADPKAEGRVWYHTVASSWNEDPGPNNNTTEFDNGTNYEVFIPWSSLGVTAEPPSGGTLRMMMRVHDIDDPRDADVMNTTPPSMNGSAEVGPLPITPWPEQSEDGDPGTWATVVLHQAPYRAPAVESEATLALTPEDVATYRDVTVGGHAFLIDRWTEGGGDPADYAWETCMDTRFGQRPDLFIHPEGGPTHLCFFARSLFYYDLAGQVPEGNVVTRAELQLFHFGGDSNEDPGTPGFDVLTSPVQVHRLEGPWLDLPLDQAVTWNTAPLAAENVGYGEITPSIRAGTNGKYVTFDVTPLAARAVLRGEPLNFALYGADTSANTGKYAVSAEGGWEPANHPQLTIVHGKPVDPSQLPSADSCTIGVAEALFDPPGTGSPDGPVDPGATSSSGGGGMTGGSGSASGGAGANGADGGEGSGCGCVVAGSPAGAAASGLLVALGAVLLRRRRVR
jgi:hypothetical protein